MNKVKKIFQNLLLAGVCLFSFNLFSADVSAPQVKQEQVVNVEITKQIDETLNTIKERLLLVHEEAKVNWNTNAPIENADAQKSFIEQMTAKGNRIGIDTKLGKEIFEGQVRAARLIQINDFQGWVKSDAKTFKSIPDYDKDLAPQIADANEALLNQLKTLAPHLKDEKVRNLIIERSKVIVVGDGISDKVRKAAVSPFIMSLK